MTTICICPVCHSRYEQVREWQKFCSKRCRKHAHREEVKRILKLAKEAGLDREVA